MTGPPVRPGQIYIDNDPRMLGRELVVQAVTYTHAFCRSTEGRATRIDLRRLRQPHLYRFVPPAAHYVSVRSESNSNLFYEVWTGDYASPPHCPCEDFRYARRTAGERYLCKHLRRVLNGEGES